MKYEFVGLEMVLIEDIFFNEDIAEIEVVADSLSEIVLSNNITVYSDGTPNEILIVDYGSSFEDEVPVIRAKKA